MAPICLTNTGTPPDTSTAASRARDDLSPSSVLMSKSTPSKTELESEIGTAALCGFFPMSSDRVIIDAIKVAKDLLWQNLPPTHNLTDAATVMRFRELVRSQAIRSALERSSDTLLAFSLRAVERVVSDQSRTNRETINRLWDVLDDPHLNRALGIPQNSRTFRRSGF